MIDRLKPYPKMRESGISWLGAVPGHWALLPNRAVFREVNERDHPDDQMLSVTITRGIIRQDTLLTGTTKKDSSNLDRSAYKLVHPQDIVYNKMRAWQGAIGVSDRRGIVSPAYVVQRLRNGGNARYFHYLLRTPAFAKEAERWSYGITSDMWSLRPEHFKMIYSCVPPDQEQEDIVRFLDHAEQRIRRYVRAKQRLIKLLEEQKQAIVHRAVTRGLDPSVRLRPSGIDWLGAIPERWDVKRAKFYYREIDERSSTGSEELLSVSHITGVTPRSEKNVTMFRPESYVGHKLCSAGDLVINTMWAWAGALGISRGVGLVSPSYGVYRPLRSGEFAGEFVDVMLRIPAYVGEYLARSTGIRKSRLRLYPEEFLRVPLLQPPLSQQVAIINHLMTATGGLREAIYDARREMELLREFHARLIADVVTGQLDVREAAALLPEEAEEPELLDQVDLLPETEENALDEEADV